jgi:hypothetical protein
VGVSKATSCELWHDCYNSQGADFWDVTGSNHLLQQTKQNKRKLKAKIKTHQEKHIAYEAIKI